jgi:putative heme iron utilization protein
MPNNSTHDAPVADQPTFVVGANLPRTSGADAARSIVDTGRVATLATLTIDPPGFPFGSVVSYAVDPRGDPLFYISELAEHTRNLRADGRASLLATESVPDDVDPLSLGRVTLIGTARPVLDDELAGARQLVTQRHPAVAGYADYGDFACWRLAVSAVRWVGGFGRMNWIGADAYRTATPDSVLAARHGIIAHMNDDHADAGVLLCRRALGIAGHGDVTVSTASLEGVDCFGCDYVASTSAGTASIRIAFEQPVASLTAVRGAVVALVRHARVT